MNTLQKDKQTYACFHGSSIMPVRPARKPSQVIGYRVVPYIGNMTRPICSDNEMWFTKRTHAFTALFSGMMNDEVGAVLQLFVFDKSTDKWHYDGNIAHNI